MTQLTRRAVLGAAAALAAPRLACADDALYAAAKKERELTWYTAHTDGETAEAVGRGFTEAFPGLKVNIVRTTAQVAYQRIVQDLKSGAAQCDVFSSTDVGHDVQLKKEGRFARYVPANAATVVPEFRGFDPDGYFHPTSAGLVLITYNTQKLKEADAPKSWKELLDPRWKGRVSVGHPGFSGYVGTWAVLMKKLYGWDYFETLEKNRPQIGRSINDTVTMLNSGERWVAAGPSATTLKSADKGNPVALIYPEEGALLMISPSAVMANAPHPNAARLFMEFLLSPEHARISVRDRGESLRPEVAPLAGGKRFTEVKVLRPTIAEIVEGIPDAIERWRDTFGT